MNLHYLNGSVTSHSNVITNQIIVNSLKLRGQAGVIVRRLLPPTGGKENYSFILQIILNKRPLEAIILQLFNIMLDYEF